MVGEKVGKIYLIQIRFGYLMQILFGSAKAKKIKILQL